jgi:hypothetical protein
MDFVEASGENVFGWLNVRCASRRVRRQAAFLFGVLDVFITRPCNATLDTFLLPHGDVRAPERTQSEVAFAGCQAARYQFISVAVLAGNRSHRSGNIPGNIARGARNLASPRHQRVPGPTSECPVIRSERIFACAWARLYGRVVSGSWCVGRS